MSATTTGAVAQSKNDIPWNKHVRQKKTPGDLAVDFVRGAHHRQLFKRHDLALSADVDAHPFRLAGDIQKAQDLRLLLKQVECPAQVAHVAGEITDGQQVALSRNHHLVLRL